MSKLDCTGLVPQPAIASDGGHVGKVIFEQSLIIDEETLQPVVKVTERDIDKEIQTFKDQCGMEFVLRQIAAGRMSVDAIRDHGNEGMDLEGTPESINDACQFNLAMQEEGQKAAKDLGMKMYTEAEFQEAVNKAIKEAAAAKAANAGGDK